jgi:hypothetical protein
MTLPGFVINQSGLATSVGASITATINNSGIPVLESIPSNASGIAQAGLPSIICGASLNPGEEGDENYVQVYNQIAGGVARFEGYMNHWSTGATSASNILFSFYGYAGYNGITYTQQMARCQAQGTRLILDVINGSVGTSPAQFPWMNTYIINSTTAYQALSAIATGFTSFFNTPGTPAAYVNTTNYVYGNTVSYGGLKWTCVAPCVGVAPALGALNASGLYCWLMTQSAIYAYNIENEAATFGNDGQNIFNQMINNSGAWISTFAQEIYAGDPAAKIMMNNSNFAYNGTIYGSTQQNTKSLALLNTLISGGGIGGPSNILFGIENHPRCSMLQATNGTTQGGSLNAVNFAAFIQEILATGAGYGFTESDIADDMYQNVPNNIPLRLAAQATALTNLLSAISLVGTPPAIFIWWQIRSPESWLNKPQYSIYTRPDGLTQFPNLFQDENYTQQPVYPIFINWLSPPTLMYVIPEPTLSVDVTPCAPGQMFDFPNTCMGVPGPPPVTIWKYDGSIEFNGLHTFGSGM